MSVKKQNKQIVHMNFFAFLNNIIIVGMSKGQLLPILAFVLSFTMILKLPGEKVYEIISEMLVLLKKGYLIGYALFGIQSIVITVCIKSIRRNTAGEFKRIGNEKSDLQRKLLNGQTKSSVK